MPDRRKFSRQTIRIDATVVGNDGLVRLPATIIDHSSGGVRIRLNEDKPIPADSYLLFGNRIEPFRVAWQASQSAGLAFIEKQDVASTVA